MIISNQVLLITGASSGIGAALARKLAAQFSGIRLVLAARNQQKLEAVAAECLKTGADVLVVATDMSQVEQVKTLAHLAVEHFGRVDVLVNNAGYGQIGPIELMSPVDAKEQFAVNFHGPLVLIQALIPTMRNQGGGRIINISSIAGRLAFPMVGLYSTSKFALEALSDVLRMELEGFNIKVSIIEPGPVNTEFARVASQKMSLALPNIEKTPYRAAWQAIKDIEQRAASLAWSSEQVARVIVRAITANHPRPRYIASTGGRTLLFLMTKLMPLRLVDMFWKHFYGINLVEKDWRNRTD
ncbi:MAG: SDR family oxidoreductase [Symploca sp. SIO3C6]|uniref:SDR family oxidoreductase n=1 Tax=Symploca sp. SIO1C4 TaxID=2607765 RepID=A0A6B3NPL7_9CYAN|nr:SDR family oxidoreductase [Symploca sp. SIO3C6]NER31178.1 SDR family oxidoreductase [Symploca sp. SIO1C4]NET04158.1 SDR family oxidoreductase [Symploca sp. SIO2B6]NET51244.1 SDR family oxidoreductase [Merismopedia sp. SIO2A8]